MDYDSQKEHTDEVDRAIGKDRPKRRKIVRLKKKLVKQRSLSFQGSVRRARDRRKWKETAFGLDNAP